MSDASRIAVLMACHDRRETTLECLGHLSRQAGGITIDVYLVDDGSSDGTAAAVAARFPDARVIPADGSLFWCGGMNLAYRTASGSGEDFSYYLWLNDDTMLVPDAIARLIETHRNHAKAGSGDAIVIGAVADPETGKASYGGLRRVWPFPFTYRMRLSDDVRTCSTMNGNCVLIPAAVAGTVGEIDSTLTHARGDIDYGFRARELGFALIVAPGHVGTCTYHPMGSWRAPGMTWRERLDSLRQPKYALDEKIRVARRHYGLLWFLSPVALFVAVAVFHVWASAVRPFASWFRRDAGGS